jgi:hypothetical protein
MFRAIAFATDWRSFNTWSWGLNAFSNSKLAKDTEIMSGADMLDPIKSKGVKAIF